MTPEILSALLLILLWLVVAAFFSGVETGMYSLNKFRLNARASEGDPWSVRLQALLSQPGELISTLLVGTNISIYVATAQCTGLVDSLHDWKGIMWPAFITTLLLSPLVLIFAEMIPKEIFRRRAELLVGSAGRSVHVAHTIFRPAVFVLRGLVAAVERVLRLDREKEQLLFSRKQLRDLIAVGAREGVIDPYQADMARKVMRLRRIKLREVMIPIKKTAMVEKDTSIRTFLDMAKGRRHSRIVVFDKDRTNVIGVANIFDVLYKPEQGETVGAYTEPLIVLSSDTAVPHALLKLQMEKRVMLMVMENDTPVGIVTVKDLVEEIAGELSDW